MKVYTVFNWVLLEKVFSSFKSAEKYVLENHDFVLLRDNGNWAYGTAKPYSEKYFIKEIEVED